MYDKFNDFIVSVWANLKMRATDYIVVYSRGMRMRNLPLDVFIATLLHACKFQLRSASRTFFIANR